jgi:hypothetical protein
MFAMTGFPAAAATCCTQTAAVNATGSVLHLLLLWRALRSLASMSALLPVGWAAGTESSVLSSSDTWRTTAGDVCSLVSVLLPRLTD